MHSETILNSKLVLEVTRLHYFKDLSTNSIFKYAINIIVLEFVTYLIWKFEKRKKQWDKNWYAW